MLRLKYYVSVKNVVVNGLSLPGHILEGKGCSYCNGGGTKAVICLTTGERFESIAQASKKMGIHLLV